MTLSSRLSEYFQAAFSGVYVQTFEPDDALAELHSLCRERAWTLAAWDLERGMRLVHSSPGDTIACPPANDPLSAIRALPSLASPEGTAILALRGFHRFLGSAEIVQALERQLVEGKVRRTFVVLLGPATTLPAELERSFVVVDHALPSRDQLHEIARGVASADELPQDVELERVLDAAAGLTRQEAEGAFALSLVRQGRVSTETLWELKAQSLLKGGALGLYRGGETFASIGGLNALKAFCRGSLDARVERRSHLARPRGVLLLGVPGTGKSAFAKALGAETGRPALTLDVGALMGSLVGQSEQNIRQALKIADAMAPAILFIDEVEKALAGANGSGDSGVASRLFGTLLSWLSDHESDVYVVATCNDIARLPPEFSRAQRFDGIHFLDLPGAAERQAIWRMYLARFELELKQPLPPDDGWTGAEVLACCRLAKLLDLSVKDAARNIVPVSVTAAESVERLRTWATGRCLCAERGGLYQRAANENGTRRRVRSDPSSN